MLRFSEEILLLLHDEDRGDFAPGLAPHSLNIALAGAVLMDLALENRIDTDLDHLFLVDATPLDDDLLDPTLADIARDTDTRDTNYWVAQTAKRGDEIRDKALARLINRGILESESEGIFFLSRLVSRPRRYPTIDGQTVEEVRLRIMRVLFTDEIPDPRDIVIICLADACGGFKTILSQSELSEVQDRIELVRKMDLIGQSVTRTIRELERAPLPSSASSRPRKEIPQAPGLPILGNLFNLLGKNVLHYLARQYRELGPLFEIRTFNRKILVMAGTEANLFVSRKGKDYLRSHEAWAPFGLELKATRLLTSMDGSEHFRLRRVMRDGFARARIADHLDTAVEIARREIGGWSPEVPVPCFYAFQRVITEQIGILSANTSSRAYLDDLNVYINAILKTRTARTHPTILLRMPHVRRAGKRVDEFYEKILAEHQRPQNDAPNLIDDVLELHRTDMQFLPETNLKAAVLAPFVAGLDTVPAISAFMLYNVLKHPDVLVQTRAEADALFADGLSDRSLRQMDVTHRVALETLRLYPIGLGIRRVAANSFEFAGYKIPAGTEILWT